MKLGWKSKVAIQIGVSAIRPRAAGDAIYHRLQEARGLEGGDVDKQREFVERVKAAVALDDRHVVELGSGWDPTTPLLLLGLGAAKVTTYDLNQHYSQERIDRAVASVSACLDLDAAPLLDRLDYRPGTDLIESPPAGADLALSRYVLEHVTPDAMLRIHAGSRSWLDGPWVHLVSPADHRSYSDKRLGSVDFLRYSERAWKVVAGNRFAYHNRMRLPEYRHLFDEAGWKVEDEEFRLVPEVVEAAAAMEVAPRFEAMSPEERAAGALWFVLRSVDR